MGDFVILDFPIKLKVMHFLTIHAWYAEKFFTPLNPWLFTIKSSSYVKVSSHRHQIIIKGFIYYFIRKYPLEKIQAARILALWVLRN